MAFTIEIFITKNGKAPFVDWLNSLKNKTDRYRIKERLDRLRLGNLGDWKHLGNGIFELRFDFGSGYRIHFGRKNQNLILLLSGGNKTSQKKDILKAKKYWAEYISG